ncbi:MAG: preprotein translocase subunit SecG [Xanthobacteraceae bacterium]|nr:MAG: preprotein translocase subunit SecG [Xanthobacteraceae bacterium]
MQTVLIVIHLMIVTALIGVVLLQRSEGGGLGAGGGGGGGGFLSSRGTANMLTRTTAFLAVGFFVTSLVLSWMAGFERKPASIINAPAPASQQAPAGDNGRNLLDTLRGQDQAPATPQVPRSQ